MVDWDRTHDWILKCFESDRAELTVLFEGERPSLRELVALRRCLPAFRNIPPATARARVGAGGRLELGEQPGPEARRLLDELLRVGMRAEFRNTSRVSYLPLDRTTGAALIVEDDSAARELAQAMMHAGVPVHWAAE